MSEKSTVVISRDTALRRIAHIHNLAMNEDYRGVEGATAENLSIPLFVDGYTPHRTGSLRDWTNSMLADKMDEPFFRISAYENYIVEEE